MTSQSSKAKDKWKLVWEHSERDSYWIDQSLLYLRRRCEIASPEEATDALIRRRSRP